ETRAIATAPAITVLIIFISYFLEFINQFKLQNPTYLMNVGISTPYTNALIPTSYKLKNIKLIFSKKIKNRVAVRSKNGSAPYYP
ncbi:hypothetical protein Q0Q97_19860, partial [Escherichia marmotae]|uniref:hypothetical protein n=2 Tax=Escherichia marmotae TaxID=1499973 RepID=UPI002F330CCA